ncbi:hypothetical protein GCM10009743_28140 [Kribbella swartbergensis]
MSRTPEPTTVEPLNDAAKIRYGKTCFERTGLGQPAAQPEKYRVLDGFRFANAPGDAYTPIWVVVQNITFGSWIACGLNEKGELLQVLPYGNDQVLYRAVEDRRIGAGVYAAHITRITVAIGNQPPVEAVLRHGFFYTAVPYVRVRGPRTDATRLPYTIRGYDAAGKLVYSSPKTEGEWRARRNGCYIDANGKLVAWMSDNPRPDPRTCHRSFVWNYRP